jgi:hypothetical protein
MSCEERDGLVDWLGQSEADRWREETKEAEMLFRQGHYVDVRFEVSDKKRFNLFLFEDSAMAKNFYEHNFPLWESIKECERRHNCKFDLVFLYSSGCLVAGKICPPSKRIEANHE